MRFSLPSIKFSAAPPCFRLVFFTTCAIQSKVSNDLKRLLQSQPRKSGIKVLYKDEVSCILRVIVGNYLITVNWRCKLRAWRIFTPQNYREIFENNTLNIQHFQSLLAHCYHVAPPWLNLETERSLGSLYLQEQYKDQSKDILNSILKEWLPDSDSEVRILIVELWEDEVLLSKCRYCKTTMT